MLRKAFFVLSIVSAIGASAQKFVEDGGFFIRKGCTWSPGAERNNKITFVDPITNDEITEQRLSYELPDTINGMHVFTVSQLQRDATSVGGTLAIRTYLLNALKPHLLRAWFSGKTSLRFVTVHLGSFIVDHRGQIVFFDLTDVTGVGPDGRLRNLEFSAISKHISSIVAAAPSMHPATVNGAPVLAYADLDLGNTEISYDGSDFHFKEVVLDTTK